MYIGMSDMGSPRLLVVFGSVKVQVPALSESFGASSVPSHRARMESGEGSGRNRELVVAVP